MRTSIIQQFAVYENGNAARWPLDPRAWSRHACATAGGGLTREQWADVVPGQLFRASCAPPG